MHWQIASKPLRTTLEVFDRATDYEHSVILHAEGQDLFLEFWGAAGFFQLHCPAQVARPGRMITELPPLRELLEMDLQHPFELRGLPPQADLLAGGHHRKMVLQEAPAEIKTSANTPPGRWLVLNPKMLRRQLTKLKRCICRDHRRSSIGCIELQPRPTEGRLQMTATDGHRLSAVSIPTAGHGGRQQSRALYLPLDTFTMLLKLLSSSSPHPLKIAELSEHIELSQDPWKILVERLDPGFPDWRKALRIDNPDREGIELQRHELAEAAKSLLEQVEHDEAIILHLARGGCWIARQKEPEKQTPLHSNGSHEPMSIGLSPAYLLDLCRQIDASSLRLLADDPISPLRAVDPANTDDVHVLMPMQL